MQRALATVDLECIRHNVSSLRRRLAPGCSFMAMVKANGYGHGAEQVARASLEAGADALGVATAGEALELLSAGIDCQLAIMGPLTEEEAAKALEAGVEVTLWSYPFLKYLIDKCRRDGLQAKVHLKVDTGMRRIGFYPRELPGMLDAIETAPEIELAGLMTHFATADEEDEDFFKYQLRTFDEAVQVMLRTGTRTTFHCANSAATIRYPESHYNMVRCGIGIYGLSPFQRDAAEDDLRPALRLTSYLAGSKRIAEGDSVGYGCTWTAPAETNLGLVPIGYGDGVYRLLSNRGDAIVAGKRCPIVGRISMDLLTVDLGPGFRAEPEEEVVLIGSQGDATVSAEEVAAQVGTINYEVTCNLSPRVPRRYLG